jgi:hypothetical protein
MGGQAVANQLATYGTLGVPNVANTPGALSGPSLWFDESRFKLYLFGGQGWTNSTSGSSYIPPATRVFELLTRNLFQVF